MFDWLMPAFLVPAFKAKAERTITADTVEVDKAVATNTGNQNALGPEDVTPDSVEIKADEVQAFVEQGDEKRSLEPARGKYGNPLRDEVTKASYDVLDGAVADFLIWCQCHGHYGQRRRDELDALLLEFAAYANIHPTHVQLNNFFARLSLAGVKNRQVQMRTSDRDYERQKALGIKRPKLRLYMLPARDPAFDAADHLSVELVDGTWQPFQEIKQAA